MATTIEILPIDPALFDPSNKGRGQWEVEDKLGVSLVILQAMGPSVGLDQVQALRTDAAGNLRVTTASSTAKQGVFLTDSTGATVVTGLLVQDGMNSTVAEQVAALVSGYDGTATKVMRTASAAVLATQSGLGAQLVSPIGEWSITNAPAPPTQATVTRAAGGAGVRHVCTGYCFGFSASVAPVASTYLITLRDGASGAGTVLKSWSFDLPAAVIPPFAIDVSGLEIVGSAATAMTMEFAGGLANFREFVNLAGHDAS